MTGNLTWLFLLLACLYITAECRNPGFKARITDKGLKYANDVAIAALKTNVEKTKIPDQSGSASGFKYDIKNIRVTRFNPPTSSFTSTAGQGLKWTARNALISVHGDFHYKKWFVSDGGSFDATVSGVNFDLGVNLGKDNNGRPSISVLKSSSSIGDVDFKFHGGMAWLYNLFRNKVGDLIKGQLSSQIGKLIKDAINVDAEKKLASLPVTTPMAKKFLLDYRLTQAPVTVPGYLETYHKGEVYWLDAPDTECPLQPPTMPANNDTQNMLYLWVSDYLFDTMAYVAQQNNYLKYNLTQKDLPKDYQGVLNTSCDGFIPKCIGKLIPAISTKYPNQVVDVRMRSTVAPKMTIIPAGVSVKCAGTMDLYARKTGDPVTPFLLTLDATMSTNVDISMKDELIYAKVKDMKINLKAGKSAVGPVSETFLDFLIKEVLDLYLVPQLNDLGGKGFPLPVTNEFKFTNTKLSFVQDTMLVGTDLAYTPSAAIDSEPVPDVDVDTSLKFVPHNARPVNIKLSYV